MSAAVCQKRHFDELHGSPPLSSPLSKRRCAGNSPVRFLSSPRSSSNSDLQQLRALFTEMDEQVVEKVLEDCGNNLEEAIKCLNGLRLSNEPDTSYAQTSPPQQQEQQAQASSEGNQWVELFVREMLSSATLDDARARATRALESFEKAVAARSEQAVASLQKENETLKNQLEVLVKDNGILTRGFMIRHERFNSEAEERAREMKQLKQILAQREEQLRISERNNYALTVHLQRAQDHTSMPGRFHPDVF